jgi:molybdenum cofactor biosynthesis protein B
VITVSDSRTLADDRGGATVVKALERAGHAVVSRRILPDEPRRITAHLRALARASRARVVVLTGGTGIARRDRTYEAIDALLEKRLDGFGELFRMLSYREIGAAAMLSRAVAGTWRGRILFSLPGSPQAVALALRRLILPELPHLAGLLAPSEAPKRTTRRTRAR